jgi:hypothetical protein
MTHLTHHPYSSVLRQRAGHLQELAGRVERSLVMRLDDAPSELARRLLDRNLHQLRLAADDLRDAATRFRQRADELDLAMMVAS